jgi:hypothetical protein
MTEQLRHNVTGGTTQGHQQQKLLNGRASWRASCSRALAADRGYVGNTRRGPVAEVEAREAKLELPQANEEAVAPTTHLGLLEQPSQQRDGGGW